MSTRSQHSHSHGKDCAGHSGAPPGAAPISIGAIVAAQSRPLQQLARAAGSVPLDWTDGAAADAVPQNNMHWHHAGDHKLTSAAKQTRMTRFACM